MAASGKVSVACKIVVTAVEYEPRLKVPCLSVVKSQFVESRLLDP
jgi:hypothetical protein